VPSQEDGDSYILNGIKYWITNGGIADYMTVFATVEPEIAASGYIAHSWLKKTGRAFKPGAIFQKIGQKEHPTTRRESI